MNPLHLLTLILSPLLDPRSSPQDGPAVPAAPSQSPPSTPVSTQIGYDDGFFIRSPDRSYELSIGGRLQFDAIEYGAERVPESDFRVRRVRLEFRGRLPGGMKFNLEPNFNPDGSEIEEAWLGFDVFEASARLMFGRMKGPFGLEERSQQGNIDFPRFSILHQFSPGEDHGVFLYGNTPSKAFGYDVAIYNGTGNSDTNGSKDVGARAVWRPFVGDEGSSLKNLQIGVAATYGVQDDDVTGGSIANEPQLPVIRFADDLRLDGRRTRVGLEGAWYRGPWFAQAELIDVQQDMSLGTDDRSIGFTGGYLTVSHVLTGEDKSFGATKPVTPFSFETGHGRGAWILAARLSDLKSDSELGSAGFSIPGSFTNHIRTASLGLDWVPNEHVILRHALVHTWYSNDVELDRGTARSEDSAMIELQLSF